MIHSISAKLNKEEFEMLRELTKRFGTTKNNIIKSSIRRMYYTYLKNGGIKE